MAYLDYHDVIKVNSCPWPRPRLLRGRHRAAAFMCTPYVVPVPNRGQRRLVATRGKACVS